MSLSHFDEHGASRMVDVGEKAPSRRSATASAKLRMSAATLRLIQDRGLAKGDVLEVARIAGIQGAKRTWELIPLCHPLALDSVKIDFTVVSDEILRVEATAALTARTGVEMEALTAVSVAALTIYDMIKGVDRGVVIEQIQLEEKTGGRSGTWRREEPAAAAQDRNLTSPDDRADDIGG